VLLDEIGELPLGTQAKILRVVERGELLSIGSLKVKTVDIRFIAATNRDLPKEAAAGRFRLDLYHRLNGVSLRIPPLRSRREEILPLAAAFARAHLTRMRRPEAALRLSPPAEALLLAHPWPGNVRELKHAIERALVLADEGPIEPQHLQLGEEQDFGLAAPALAVARSEPLSPSEVAEAQRIRDALEECGGNQAKAAKLLGIARGTLASRMDRFGIGRPRK
jgi:DNA-binding NtrC family response regulator